MNRVYAEQPLIGDYVPWVKKALQKKARKKSFIVPFD
jgi:hypothetical protein